MSKIVPALLCESAAEFDKKLRQVENACDVVQIDVLDGTLFPHVSWFDPIAIGQLSTNVSFELHLMVENPIPIIEAFQKHIKAPLFPIVHAEMHRPIGAVVGFIKDQLHLPCGVAINPETPLKEIEEVLHTIDQLTIMGVHPGKMGQTFLGDVIFDKIEETKIHRPELLIEIDGGVTEALLPKLIASGCHKIVSGSLIFSHENPHLQLINLQRLCSIGDKIE